MFIPLRAHPGDTDTPRRGRWRTFTSVATATLTCGAVALAWSVFAPAAAAGNSARPAALSADPAVTPAPATPAPGPTAASTPNATQTGTPQSALPALGVFKPCFSGKLSVGNVITAVLGPIEAEIGGVLVEYQWMRDGEEIPGATSKSYLLTDEDAGSILAVRITASKPGYATEVKVSCARKISAKATAVTPRAVKVRGTMEVGSTAKVVGRSWGDDVTMQYRWTCDHKTLKVTTKSTLKLDPELAGCHISVAVRGYAKGKGSAVSVTDHPEVEGLTMSLPAPQIGALDGQTVVAADAVKAGTTLKAVWTPETPYEDFAVGWEWLADGEPIPDQTGDTYVVAWEDADKTISARGTASATGYEDVMATTASVTVLEVVHPVVPPGEVHRPRGT